ncbi:MAG: hypothetical protein ACRDWA_11775 [Acidimicrobiia bacterium]
MLTAVSRSKSGWWANRRDLTVRPLRVHPVKHDTVKAHGAFANPGGKADRINAAS